MLSRTEYERGAASTHVIVQCGVGEKRVEEGGLVFVELKACNHVVEAHAVRAARPSGSSLVLNLSRIPLVHTILSKLFKNEFFLLTLT